MAAARGTQGIQVRKRITKKNTLQATRLYISLHLFTAWVYPTCPTSSTQGECSQWWRTWQPQLIFSRPGMNIRNPPLMTFPCTNAHFSLGTFQLAMFELLARDQVGFDNIEQKEDVEPQISTCLSLVGWPFSQEWISNQLVPADHSATQTCLTNGNARRITAMSRH